MRHLAILAILFAAGLSAQTITGSITGSVKDTSGLAVVGAAVNLTDISTGAQRKAATGERGDFVFASLQPSEYKLAVTQSGFKIAERLGIVLSASEFLSIGDVVLEVGAVTEAVTITAQGAVVQTASAERSGLLTNNQVQDLLIRSRTVMSLLQLLPGVVDLAANEAMARNWNVNVNGNRQNTSSVALDGMSLNAIGNNNNSLIGFSQEAIAEVKVLLGNYQAEYGRMSGANITLVTKSGSRDFHGLGSYFKRHEQFNANDFFNNRLGQPKPRYRYNTWSYNVGGPVYIPGKFNRNRDKLFFFFNQEYWPSKTSAGPFQLTVPTEIERAGDFSQSLDLNNKLIVVSDPTGRQPFPGNRVPASIVEPSGQALLKLLPAANFFDRSISAGRYNYVYQTESSWPQRLDTLKLDYYINSANIVTSTFSDHSDRLFEPAATWGQLWRTAIRSGWVSTNRYQHIFSPTLINEFTFGYATRPESDVLTEDSLRRNQRDQAGFKVAQLNPGSNPLKLVPNATFGGVSSPAQLNIEGRTPLVTTHQTLVLSDSITKTRGAHTAKAGLYVDRIWRDAMNAIPFNGSFDFARNANNPLETGYAYSNAITGVFNSYTETSMRRPGQYRLSNVEWYAQDNWKVSRRLTLDYGLRFAWIQPIFEAENFVSGFVPGRFDAAKRVQLIAPAMVGGKRAGVHPVTGAVYPAALIGAIAPGVGDLSNGMVVTSQDKSYPRSLIENRGVQFAPRVGFAFDPFGKGKTALRGGFGMFYNRQNLDAALNPFTTQSPLVLNPTVNFGTFASLASSTGMLFPQAVFGIDRAGMLPSIMNFSFMIQHNVGFGTVVEAGYVGSLGRHLMWQRNLNAIPFGANFDPKNADRTNTGLPLSPGFLRPYAGYDDITFREWAASSNYHSMQVTANRRFAKGLQFGLAWTWSKAMDFNSTDTSFVSTLIPVRVWNYGLSNFDRTHVVKINALWEVPKGRWGNPLLKGVFNGWQLSGIASFISGAPASIGYGTTVATDVTGSPTDGARVVVTGNPVLPKSERTFSRYFETNVFQMPARGTVGNSARSLIRGPGANNWDTAVFKNFPLRERMRFQFRWELYNAFNHTQYSGVDTTARFDPQGKQVNARLGEITAARNSRQMQLALRFYF